MKFLLYVNDRALCVEGGGQEEAGNGRLNTSRLLLMVTGACSTLRLIDYRANTVVCVSICAGIGAVQREGGAACRAERKAGGQ